MCDFWRAQAKAAYHIELLDPPMEKDGIVGPADGPRPREVLKKREWMNEWDQAPR